MKVKFLLISFFFICFSSLFAQKEFAFRDSLVAPGTTAHYLLPISAGTDSTFIPISIFHGSEEGPVLGITAGVHGYEYPPIMAGQALIKEIDPAELKGTVILVQIANVESFLGRSPFVNPLDGKNLNRVFPGNKEGSLTERIAHVITTEVISRSDFFLDMHGGDASEDLKPYVAYYQNDFKPEASSQGMNMALSMGFDHIIKFKSTGKDYMKEDQPSLYCSAEAFKRGIPSIDIECGKLGRAEPLLIQKITQSVLHLLAHLGMTEEASPPIKPHIIVEERTSLSSPHTGIFYSEKRSGLFVSKGMEIGYITDFFGKTLEKVIAPESGVILYMLGTPPVNTGETLVVIGKVNP